MRDRILAEIRRIAGESGGTAPGRQAFERETGIKPSAWIGRYWARWGDAIRDAGLEANNLTQKLDAQDVLPKIANAMRHFKRIPTVAEYRLYAKNVDPDFPSHTVLQSRFSQRLLPAQLRDWVNANPGNDDLLTLLPATADAVPESRAKSIRGLVYLIRSGGFYKIGRSDELERRVKEIRVQLPEAATLEHTITTDDPSGIEAYWHRRFADRRANGEWFKLSKDDVAAFKRRKYQ